MRSKLFALLCALLFPALLVSSPACAAHDTLPRELPLDAMIGQMIMVGFRGDGSKDTPEMRTVLRAIRDGRVGGVIFFDRDWKTRKRGRNITSVTQLTALCALLQKNAPVPLFIAVDQEGGRVQRLRPDHGFAATPSASELGTGTPERTKQAGLAMGAALRAIGVNVNFAPDADVAINPGSPAIGALGRSFSGDAGMVAKHAAAFAEGLAQNGIIGSYKHFPGHGSATTDTHHDLTDITATWREEELLPYKSMPRVPLMVMTGHLMHTAMDPDYPASLSRAVTTGLLREKLGWQGVVITDDLEMDAIDRFHTVEERILLAINAGVDIILFGNNIQHDPDQPRIIHATIKKLVDTGKIPASRIAESWARIRALKASFAAAD